MLRADGAVKCCERPLHSRSLVSSGTPTSFPREWVAVGMQRWLPQGGLWTRSLGTSCGLVGRADAQAPPGMLGPSSGVRPAGCVLVSSPMGTPKPAFSFGHLERPKMHRVKSCMWVASSHIEKA